MFVSDENGLESEKNQSAYSEKLSKNRRQRVKIVWKIQSFCKVFCAVALSSVFLLGLFLFNNGSTLSKLQGEHVCEHTFYLYSASSQALQKEEITLAELSNVRGESVRFSLDGKTDGKANGHAGEMLVKEILGLYGGEIVLVEEVCGVRSYYCYTPCISERIFVEGKPVNLHIAIGAKQAAVGSPIIFGGF